MSVPPSRLQCPRPNLSPGSDTLEVLLLCVTKVWQYCSDGATGLTVGKHRQDGAELESGLLSTS